MPHRLQTLLGMVNTPQKVIEIASGPAIAVFGLSVSMEAVTHGLNMLTAFVALLAGLAGLWWTVIRIRIARKELNAHPPGD